MKEIDLRKPASPDIIGGILTCNGCEKSYVIEDGDLIERRRGDLIAYGCWEVDIVLQCHKCLSVTIHRQPLQKWDGDGDIKKPPQVPPSNPPKYY